MKIPGKALGSSASGSKVWIGQPIDIKGMSVFRADKMMVEVFYSATGALFDKIIVDSDREDTLKTAIYRDTCGEQ